MVYMILGDGFEETEAIIPCDLLRRADIPVLLAGIGGMEITGGHGITVKADCRAEEIAPENAELLILPGGLRGVASINACPAVLDILQKAYARGSYLAAICAAPTVLAALGITDGKRAVCYPGMEAQMGAAICCDVPAVTDGRVITAKAAGASYVFALELITALRDARTAQRVAAGIVLQ